MPVGDLARNGNTMPAARSAPGPGFSGFMAVIQRMAWIWPGEVWGAQYDRVIATLAGLHEISILHIRAGCPIWKVEQLELYSSVSISTASGIPGSPFRQNGIKLAHSLRIRMQAAQRQAPARQGHIQLLLSSVRFSALAQPIGFGRKSCLKRLFTSLAR